MRRQLLKAVSTFRSFWERVWENLFCRKGFPRDLDILPDNSSHHSRRVARLAASELVHGHCEDDHHADDYQLSVRRNTHQGASVT